MLNELVRLTADCVKNTLAVDVAEDDVLVSAIAQRVNPAVKIDAVIGWVFNRLSFWCHADTYFKSWEEAYEPSSVPLSKSSTKKALDQEVSQSNIKIKGMCSCPLLLLSRSLMPSQAPDRETSQSDIKTQPVEFVDVERQKIRAKNLRRRTRCFRVLIIGQANAGKTTILQRVCNTTEQPKIFNPQGRKVCVIIYTHLCHWVILLTD